MASGNCPDLIDLSMVNLNSVTAKGVLEDLTPYFQDSEESGWTMEEIGASGICLKFIQRKKI